LEANFQALEERTATMLDHHRAGRKAMDLPYDLKGCSAYGGCRYQGDPCKLTFSQLLEADLKQEKKRMDLSAKMKAAAGATAPAAPEEPAKAPPKLAASAASQASPAAQQEAAATTAAAAAQAAPAAVNPPEASKGVDLDAPAAPARVDGRLRMAGNVASGLVGARLFNHHDPGYAEQVGHLAVEITDAILKAAR
jgi:pyruvate/2-oxoglutarate dehydrogenase complex dihydrolipoamide acyltransferase (E2) component